MDTQSVFHKWQSEYSSQHEKLEVSPLKTTAKLWKSSATNVQLGHQDESICNKILVTFAKPSD